MAVSKFPDSPKAMECNFMAGESYVQKGDFAKARGYFLTCLASYPQGKYGEKSAFRIAEADFLGRELRAGEESRLDESLRKSPDSEDAPAARLGLSHAYFKTGSFDDAIKQYDMFINQYAASKLLPEGGVPRSGKLLPEERLREGEKGNIPASLPNIRTPRNGTNDLYGLSCDALNLGTCRRPRRTSEGWWTSIRIRQPRRDGVHAAGRGKGQDEELRAGRGRVQTGARQGEGPSRHKDREVRPGLGVLPGKDVQGGRAGPCGDDGEHQGQESRIASR